MTPKGPARDLTGDIYLNRKITGLGDHFRYPSGHTGYSWRWVCLECGATGESKSADYLRKYEHRCPGKRVLPLKSKNGLVLRYVPPPPRPVNRAKLCSQQCRGCGHYSDEVKGCIYILDTGKIRPKVADLRRDPCPVRDTAFRRRGVGVEFGASIGDAYKD